MEYIGTKDVSFNHIVNYANGIAIPNEHISQFKIAPSRSVLLCIEGGSAGRKIAQIEKNVCFGNKLCCFVPYMMDISEYIYCYLQSPSFFENFRGNLAGIIGGVSVNTLKSLLIPLPPIEEQKRIVAQIDVIVLGKQLAYLAKNGQAAVAGIEHPDRAGQRREWLHEG